MTVNPSDRQDPGPYPATFTVAVRPEDVATYNCDHESGLCYCVHDWRISWGNLPKVSERRATYVSA